MSVDRLSRINNLVQHEIAGALFKVMNEAAFDASRVTVTRVATSSDLRRARVSVSILGEPEEQSRLLNLLHRHRKDFQDHLAKTVVLKYTPRLSFHLDGSIEGGDRVLHLLQDLEQEHPEWLEEEKESRDV
ncbi:MAG TPA: 30S ribosome-binding factor RbfA [Kiritimatiellia bacterium]|nr:30S ribosome-binding factor RbfA [Kiritimatiellia bacterium]